MLTFVTLAALSIAVIVFLNVLSIPGRKSSPIASPRERGDAARILKMKGPERPRICPVCGTLLTIDEYLIAAIAPEVGQGQKRQAHIYGCPHCYITGGVNLTRFTQLNPEELTPRKEAHVHSS